MALTQCNREFRSGTTLIELVVSVALMALVMGSVLPLISSLRNTWDSAQNNTDALQNSRVLIDHLNLNLAQAKKITAVSPSSQTLGYIEFEDNEGDTLRYDVDAQGNVEYGLTASQSDLAGPVSQFLFTCYDGNDFVTPITDVNSVRFVKVQTTVTNAATMGQDKAMATSVYLQVNGNNASDSTMGTPLEFNTSNGQEPALAQIDSTHYVCAYTGSNDDGWATVLAVNPSTWALTQGTPYEFDTVLGREPALAQIDATHYLCAYRGDGDAGWATILTVDTDTWTITEETPLEFDTVHGERPALAEIDDTHFLCAYTDSGASGSAVILTVSSGLVGHWKLDENSGTTAADSSDNSNNGTLTNMAGDEWTSGTVDGALDFDGYNDYIAVPHADEFLADNGTVALWFNGDNVSSTDGLLSKDSSDYDTGGHLTIRINSSQVQVRLQSTSNSYSISSGTLQDDTWYHVALSWGSAGMKLYMNGTEVDTDAYTGGLGTSSGGIGNYEPMALGACNWGSDNLVMTPIQDFFDGTIDDVRFYSRALSDAEIATLAQTLRYEEFSEAKAGTDATSLTVPAPASTSAGDLLVAAVATDGDTASSLAPPGGQGWTEIDLSDYDSEVTLGAWWKTAGASEPSHQFTWSGAEQAYAWIMRFSGHDAADPIDVLSASNTTGSSPTSPAVTTTVDNAMILRLGAFDDNDITLDAPGLSGHTAISMDTTVGGGQVSFQEFTEKKLTANGSAVTLDTPAGTSAGDLLIATVVTDGDTYGAMAPPGGQGWAEIYRGDESNRVSLGTWWKLAGASEASTHQFTWSGGQEAYAWMMRFTGHDPSSPIHISEKHDSTSSSPDCDPVTTTLADCMILRIGGFDDGDIQTIDVTGLNEGHTDITMDESSPSNGECSGGAGYEQQATPGTTSTPDFNLTRSEQYITVTVAIAPDTSGGGGTGSVSGGAGYVKQASAGSSGTSTFSLTASEQGQLLTVAISPAAQSEAGATVLAAGPAYEVTPYDCRELALIQIDTTHYLCAMRGPDDDGWAKVITINTSTWAISDGTPFEFDDILAQRPALAQIDSTHYLCVYAGNGDDGWAVVLTVNNSTWTITKGTPFEFDAVKGMEAALVSIGSNDFLCAYRGDGDDGWSTVLTVNTSDWTISQGTPFEFDTQKGTTPALIQIDADHYLCTYAGNGEDGWSVVLMPSTTGVAP